MNFVMDMTHNYHYYYYLLSSDFLVYETLFDLYFEAISKIESSINSKKNIAMNGKTKRERFSNVLYEYENLS